jgi:hypothetical protein
VRVSKFLLDIHQLGALLYQKVHHWIVRVYYTAEHEEGEPSQAAFMGQATQTAYPEQPSTPPTVASAAQGATSAADITPERPTETGKSDQGHLVAKEGEGKEQPQGGMTEHRGLHEQPPAIQLVRPKCHMFLMRLMIS